MLALCGPGFLDCSRTSSRVMVCRPISNIGKGSWSTPQHVRAMSTTCRVSAGVSSDLLSPRQYSRISDCFSPRKYELTSPMGVSSMDGGRNSSPVGGRADRASGDGFAAVSVEGYWPIMSFAAGIRGELDCGLLFCCGLGIRRLRPVWDNMVVNFVGDGLRVKVVFSY